MNFIMMEFKGIYILIKEYSILLLCISIVLNFLMYGKAWYKIQAIKIKMEYFKSVINSSYFPEILIMFDILTESLSIVITNPDKLREYRDKIQEQNNILCKKHINIRKGI